MTRRGEWGAAGTIVLLALCAFAIRARYYFATWMEDDAFISFRYARNLARGNGLVYNVGEYVEGYSNFLWTVMIAGFHALGAGIPEAARVLGLALGIATAFLYWRPGVRWDGATEASRSVTLLLASVPTAALWLTESWVVWSVSGLENVFGALLVLGAFLAYFRSFEAEHPTRDRIVAGTLAALAALTHPSYAVFGGVLGAHATLRGIRERSLAAPVTLAIPPLLLGAPFLLWKLAYYGELLPNTYHAKVGFTPAMFDRGVGYLAGLARGLPLVAAVPVLALLWALVQRERDPRPWIVLGGIAAYAAYIVGVGGDAFPAHRQGVVFLPLVCLLLHYLVATATRSRVATAVVGALTAALVLGCAAINGRSERVRALDKAIERDALGRYRSIGLALRERLAPDSLVAYSGAGVVAYYCELPFLDMLGLTNAHIARAPVENLGAGVAGHEKTDDAYVFSRRPHVILIGRTSDLALAQLPGFGREYEIRTLRVRFTPRGSDEETRVPARMFVRRDVPPLKPR